MIAVVDYGAGNIFSVLNALKYLGEEYKLISDKDNLFGCSHIILPGVGAFGDAVSMLKERELYYPLMEEGSKKPFLGICLGMQLLFERGFEFGENSGLGLIGGSVQLIQTKNKIPHMGWNSLVYNDSHNPLLCGVKEGSCVYFVHSYMAYTEDKNIAAYCEYGIKVPALVAHKNVFGAQFHPEKSGEAGLRILKNFCSIKAV